MWVANTPASTGVFLLKIATRRLVPQERHRVQGEWLQSYNLVEQGSDYYHRSSTRARDDSRAIHL